MSANFQLLIKRRGSDMHVDLTGDFDGSAAWQLVRAMLTAGKEVERIRINTDKVREALPFGVSLLGRLMKVNSISRNKVIFQGEKAQAIGFIDGYPIHQKNVTCQCNNRCSRCKCTVKSVRPGTNIK